MLSPSIACPLSGAVFLILCLNLNQEFFSFTSWETADMGVTGCGDAERAGEPGQCSGSGGCQEGGRGEASQRVQSAQAVTAAALFAELWWGIFCLVD